MSYSSITAHRNMVFDELRNSLYGQAMRRLITPDTVVLDLGAGLGLHGLMAAACGAKRVYLVEQDAVVRHARDLAPENGLADRIEVIQGSIETIVLPEKVDLIISVLTGNLLFSEDLLPSLFYARDHFLKPGGKLLPDLAELVFAPVNTAFYHDREIARWSAPVQNLDFSSLRRFAANELIAITREEPAPVLLAPGKVFCELDLALATEAACDGRMEVVISTTGLCHGLLGWINIRLGEQWLSTKLESKGVHWIPLLLPVDPPLPLVKGERLEISLQRPEFGEWSWQLKAAAGKRRHSMFLTCYGGPELFRKISPQYDAALDGRGKQALLVLGLMQEGLTNGDIARKLTDRFPTDYADTLHALRFVQKLARQYRT